MMHNNVAVHACKENASCRSISSLGGSFIQANADNMSIGAQVAMSAVIGGTAEKLGGGKFANGAVTGAYVMMFNHLGGGADKRLQRRFQRNAISDPYLANYSPHEYINGEIVQTASGNEYILWDNKWLDLPEWQTKEVTYGPVWDGGEGSVGVTVTISRETYIKQEYLSAVLSYSRWGLSLSSFTTTDPRNFLRGIVTGGIDNMLNAESLLMNRMKVHDASTIYYRNKD